MEQEKLAALVRLIMSDKRILDLISGVQPQECAELTLIETKDLLESLPFQWRSKVYCQELRDGGDGLICLNEASAGEWKQIRVYQPSLNLIAKLALGIADECLPKLIQEKLLEGGENIELVRLCNLTRIKAESYRKLFLGYLEKLKGFGIKINEDGFKAIEADFPTAVKTRINCPEQSNANIWQYKALTEKDLLDIEKGTTLTVGRKCIITSLAVDMARRKSIQICREGEVK